MSADVLISSGLGTSTLHILYIFKSLSKISYFVIFSILKTYKAHQKKYLYLQFSWSDNSSPYHLLEACGSAGRLLVTKNSNRHPYFLLFSLEAFYWTGRLLVTKTRTDNEIRVYLLVPCPCSSGFCRKHPQFTWPIKEAVIFVHAMDVESKTWTFEESTTADQ